MTESTITPERREALRDLTEESEFSCVTVTAENLLSLLTLADERDALAAAVGRVRALHAPEPFWMPNGEVWYRCRRCQYASDRPCETYRALDEAEEPPVPMTQEEKIAYRLAWDARVEEGKRKK